MSDTSSTQATLDALHALGVSVAIDDFGTGYSSLSYLKRFDIDVVKLDRTFIEGLVTDPVDAEIASAVIRLSAALDISTVAEGVETDSQRQMLVKLGCPLIQGYLTARPLPAPDFLRFWDGGYTTTSEPATNRRSTRPTRTESTKPPTSSASTPRRFLDASRSVSSGRGSSSGWNLRASTSSPPKTLPAVTTTFEGPEPKAACAEHSTV